MYPLQRTSRTALISDIHGNFAGLQAVMTDIQAAGCDRVLCLGDLVDGGPDDTAVVRYLRDRQIPCIRGNHDEYPDPTLPADVLQYLRDLRESFIEEDTIYTHISPRVKQRNISSDVEAWNVFEETPYRLIFIGHVHVPHIYGQKCDRPVSATEYPITYGQEFPLDPEDRYIICIGSIGYPRDALRKLRYGIFDSGRQTIEMRVVEGEMLAFG